MKFKLLGKEFSEEGICDLGSEVALLFAIGCAVGEVGVFAGRTGVWL